MIILEMVIATISSTLTVLAFMVIREILQCPSFSWESIQRPLTTGKLEHFLVEVSNYM